MITKMRITSKVKKITINSEQIDIAINTKVDEKTSIIKKKRIDIKFKKMIINNKNNDNITKINLFIIFLVILFKKRNCKTSIVNDVNVNVFNSKLKTSKKAKIIESLKNFIEITISQEFSFIIKIEFLRKYAIVTKKKIVRKASYFSDKLMFNF